MKKSIDRFKIFKDLSKYCTGAWSNLIIDMGSGILPKHFKYDGSYLTFVKGVKTKTILIPWNSTIPSDEEGAKASFAVMNFMEECLGKKIAEEIDDTEEEIIKYLDSVKSPQKWSDIRKKCVKEKYISEYIRTNSSALSLGSFNDCVKMYEGIMYGLSQGLIQTKDVNFSDGKIISIGNIVFDKRSKKVSYPEVREVKSAKQSYKKDTGSIMEKKWVKYLTILKKKIKLAIPKKTPDVSSYKTTGF